MLEAQEAWLTEPKKRPVNGVKNELKAHWLLVFDGVENPSDLDEFNPVFGSGAILITTQDQEFAASLPCSSDDVLSIRLDFFPLRLTGDHEAASRLLEKGLLDREEAFGREDKESFRTGRFYHVLGNVRYDQDRIGESKIYHRRALKQYIDTLGQTHHRTADLRHKVAQHCMPLRSWNLDVGSFQHEIARTTWLSALHKGKEGNPEEKKALLKTAADMYNKLRPENQKCVAELEERDFDDLVAFWSRGEAAQLHVNEVTAGLHMPTWDDTASSPNGLALDTHFDGIQLKVTSCICMSV
ncbi:uncharacterized protein MYCFIDRAFT_176595 [Pseudocercospora fijiensis CIRAD86]|uniref:NB-ARC domain-containing protein n=1 Tax=Pseudocercospora fijiensis (strain CIRAD86) TaxID=383855 RepID=M3A9K5_PSEFD|nr:uncharacterized protein MYCFIDRAFT_176595 [Pseudocercospora fijiensis CIRAD86]EME81306.1 hypothetical protein MYCFIDRAFT_176595 [Pseudocercospora fijiensis CIRAD86]